MKFTIEHYNHIKKNGFKPNICRECQEIDIALKDNAQLLSDLYEACKSALGVMVTLDQNKGWVKEISGVIQKALAKVDRKEK